MINAMQQAGLSPGGDLTADGKLHRFDVPGDRAKSENGWYILYDGDIQSGAFGSWKTGQSEKWCSKTKSEFTPEEKKAYAARMEAARRQRDAEQALVHEQCRTACKQIWEAGTPAVLHPYLVKKNVPAYGLKQSGDLLMVPMLDPARVIHGIQFISPDGTKKFKTGTAKQGKFHAIGKPVDSTVIICEGYATAASIHEATGHFVLVAFDAGNLKPVAELFRKRQPGFKIIIAGDNDQWTEGNPGITKGREAARAVNGEFVYPQFPADDPAKRTDFNDLGRDEVAGVIFPPPIADYIPPGDEDVEIIPESFEPAEFREHPLQNAPFVCLGHDRGEYFFMSRGTGQVVSLPPAGITTSNMLALARLDWWEGAYPGKPKFNETAARNMLIQTCQQIGIYDSDRVRGLGAWEDKNRSVLHLGNTLVVDNQRVEPSTFKSKYIYERAISIADEATAPLPNAEANKLIALCDMLSWEDKLNGRLLAGWCVASIICGALKWRPHIWLTGPSGSGKSWVIHNIIKHISGPHLKGMLGSTSEAGLRNALRNDAFSVFFDEFEAEDKNAAARIQSILEFARPASCNEDSKIYKAKSGGGGVNSYQPRSCIGVASINVNMTKKADISRVTVLSLVPGSESFFDNTIQPFWNENVRPPEYARGLRSRSIAQIPTINANAEVFQQAVTIQMRSRRQGDQYGSLLACAYSLCSSNKATLEQAKEFVGKQNWTGHTLSTDQGDEQQCLNAILETILNVGGGVMLSVAELISQAHEKIDNALAKEALERHGLKYVSGGFHIHNNHSAVKRMLANTPWAGNYARIIERLPDAFKQQTQKFCKVGGKCTLLPITYVKGDEE